MTFSTWARGLGPGVAGALLLAVAGGADAGAAEDVGPATGPAADARVVAEAAFCAADPSPPEYYAFPLVTTKRVPGTGNLEGRAEVLFGSTPYGVSLAPDGSYLYELRLRIDDLPRRSDGDYVAWVTTPSLDRIERLGTVGSDGTVNGSVRWNKFLVVVTLEPRSATADEDHGGDGDGNAGAASTWSGPVVARGMSQSGKMHTMAGHGPFQQENCAAYGYDD